MNWEEITQILGYKFSDENLEIRVEYNDPFTQSGCYWFIWDLNINQPLAEGYKRSIDEGKEEAVKAYQQIKIKEHKQDEK